MDTLSPHGYNGNPSQIPDASGIYKITCLATHKIYIGSTTNLRRRRSTHLSNLRLKKHGNPKLQNAWNTYGEHNFTFEVLELVLLSELLTAREQYWIDKLKAFGEKGYNIAHVAGSRFGVKDSPETREKKRKAHVGLTPILGRKPSPEAIEKQRRAVLGRKHSDEAREKIHLALIGNKSKLGQKLAPETIEKIRLSKIGRKHPRRNTP